MTEDNQPSAENKVSRLLDFQERCPDCAVAVGEAHPGDEYDGCDVARCLVTGLQRLSCEADHDCGQDVWTGWWPGQLDCEQLGWMIGPGLPDLNRLYTQAVWNPERCQWVKPT
ncbi:MAG: hypothetical protein JWQ81_946 [Amycolatopsis sp.]|uniref:hypothetical protein n=1 Tax=Amycolatopsis sp. TaxID=37632 RepID=UPI00262C0E36|nr:hypothetical protein [Amycolatopsis sp.]MCU1680207.1 hypothetical protein [Amycolatopsis sp.]